MKSSRLVIKELLYGTKRILNSDNFDVETDYILIRSKKERMEFSTPTTLVDLDFDDEDVIDTIRGLNMENYSHTLVDQNDDKPPYLFVFGKEIKGRMVYIKFKIREGKRKVVCISFHYAEQKLNFPYLNNE